LGSQWRHFVLGRKNNMDYNKINPGTVIYLIEQDKNIVPYIFISLNDSTDLVEIHPIKFGFGSVRITVQRDVYLSMEGAKAILANKREELCKPYKPLIGNTIKEIVVGENNVVWIVFSDGFKIDSSFFDLKNELETFYKSNSTK